MTKCLSACILQFLGCYMPAMAVTTKLMCCNNLNKDIFKKYDVLR